MHGASLRSTLCRARQAADAAMMHHLCISLRKRSRSQCTQIGTKRDADTGRLKGGKKDGTPFRGVRKER